MSSLREIARQGIRDLVLALEVWEQEGPLEAAEAIERARIGLDRLNAYWDDLHGVDRVAA